MLARASGLPTFACHVAVSVTQDFQFPCSVFHKTDESDGSQHQIRLRGVARGGFHASCRVVQGFREGSARVAWMHRATPSGLREDGHFAEPSDLV